MYIDHIKLATFRHWIKFKNVPPLQSIILLEHLWSFTTITKVWTHPVGYSPKFWELGPFLGGHLSDNLYIKQICYWSHHFTCVSNSLFSPLSTIWGIISFCHCISFGLLANQTTHSLKSLALFYRTVYLTNKACHLKGTLSQKMM